MFMKADGAVLFQRGGHAATLIKKLLTQQVNKAPTRATRTSYS